MLSCISVECTESAIPDRGFALVTAASHKQKAVLAPFFVWQDRSGTTLSRSLCWALRLDAAAAVFTHCDPEEHVFSVSAHAKLPEPLSSRL